MNLNGTTIAVLIAAIGMIAAVTQPAGCAEDAPLVVPRTTEAMQTPEFWIGNIEGNPDRVMLTPSQIKALNELNRTRPFETTDVFGNPYSIRETVEFKDVIGIQFRFGDPLAIRTFSGDSLRARFDRVREYFEDGDYFTRITKTWTRAQKDELYTATDYESIPDSITPRYGILVKHTLHRVLPTADPAWRARDGWLDRLQATSVDFGTPVAVLHMSKARDWYFVRSELAFGWVPAENVAFGSPADIRAVTKSDDFIVSVAHKVPLYADAGFETFIADFYMGARVPLIARRASGYELTVPVRQPDGSLAKVTGWARPDAPVHVGYQQFTQRNVLNTVFSLLYRPYSWADASNERDCCGTMRVVYKTFGLHMPRWTTHELHFSNNVNAFPQDTPKDKKYEILDTVEPAVTLVGDAGHICMYIGKVDGRYYVIHQSGYSYRVGDGPEMMVRRVNVNDTELEGGSYIGLWTEISEFTD